jgi:hypothetical protein
MYHRWRINIQAENFVEKSQNTDRLGTDVYGNKLGDTDLTEVECQFKKCIQLKHDSFI